MRLTRPRRHPERDIQASVMQHWKALGYEGTLVFANVNANAFGQPGLTPGVFDLTVLGGNVGTGFIELKAASGKLSPEQERFKLILIRNSIPYAICYGRDQPIEVLEAWGIVRPQVRAA